MTDIHTQQLHILFDPFQIVLMLHTAQTYLLLAAMVITAMMLPTAGMPFAMLMIMMVTMDIRIITKLSLQQGVYRFVRAAGYSAVKPDSGLL